MGLPSRFLEKKFVKDEKGDDITPFDGNKLKKLWQKLFFVGVLKVIDEKSMIQSQKRIRIH